MIYGNKTEQNKSTMAYYDSYDLKRPLKIQSI